MCPSFVRCGTVEKASPECLEGTFSELRPMRFPDKLGRQQRNAEPQPRLKPYVALSVARFASLPPRSTGVSVHSCSQYVTRPPLWHTKRTPPSWEITTATDPGSAPASR